MALRPDVARSRMADAAELYWVHGMKVAAVARELDVSTSTVSRLLSEAKRRHIIEFTVNRQEDSALELRHHLEEEFHIHAVVVGTGEILDATRRRVAVGDAAQSQIWKMVNSDTVIGVAWGRTIESLSLQLIPKHLSGVEILQLHGFGNTLSFGENYFTQILTRFGTAYDAQVHLFPAPAIFDSSETREMMWKETSIRQMLELRRSLDLIITSVGTPYGATPSPLFSPGVLSRHDREELKREHVVGDVTSTFYRSDGSMRDLAINKRSTGLSREELLRVPTRMFIVADENKVQALTTALNAGLVTHLVIDQTTAAHLVRQ